MAQKQNIRKFKVTVIVGGDLSECDGIEWQGKLWLVPYWYDDKAAGVTTPARVIRFDSVAHGKSGEGYVVNDPIPKELFAVETPKQPVPGYEYVELPAMTKPEGQKPH